MKMHTGDAPRERGLRAHAVRSVSGSQTGSLVGGCRQPSAELGGKHDPDEHPGGASERRKAGLLFPGQTCGGGGSPLLGIRVSSSRAGVRDMSTVGGLRGCGSRGGGGVGTGGWRGGGKDGGSPVWD